jgi:hypothetical protein
MRNGSAILEPMIRGLFDARGQRAADETGVENRQLFDELDRDREISGFASETSQNLDFDVSQEMKDMKFLSQR